MGNSDRRSRTVKVGYLARVEGEGGLYVKVQGGEVVDVRLDIFEPPRFFEAFLRGRDFREAPDITARICGICPVAYQMSAVHALERALGVNVDGQLRNLRRLLYCGEWIESHALHVTLLHAPDFLGYADGIQMAREHRDAVERGLQLKKAGNEIMTLIGGREVHPINVRVGGFYRVPTRDELRPLEERLKVARDTALEMVRWTAAFTFPELETDYEFVALRHPNEYPFNDGRIVSSKGLNVTAAEFEEYFEEQHVAHSNALHAILKGHGAYLVGPLARYNLNFDRLSPLAQEAARSTGLGATCLNPFRSVIVRAVEILYACDEALRLIAAYEAPDFPAVELSPRAAAGAACTEAPRGMLYHGYRIAADGSILSAKIVPPTSQNQKTMEADLRAFVQSHIDLPKREMRLSCEQVVRNHDPCISCATHFLRLDLDRSEA
ncbi:MAG: Ni/Fe hydrogenase subunit alpha [Deltaproteobacteria bacterium]|nr:Ni/Fe hydrogenase subunit alpha [Deltaproteobacteria bacterium]